MKAQGKPLRAIAAAVKAKGRRISHEGVAGVRDDNERRLTASEMAADPDVPPLRNKQGGRPPKGENLKVSYVGGNSTVYLVRRLKRDAPEIAERLAAGEFRSARAAARAAGIIKPTAAADR
jgi:hypothetical protein